VVGGGRWRGGGANSHRCREILINITRRPPPGGAGIGAITNHLKSDPPVGIEVSLSGVNDEEIMNSF